MEIKTQKVWIQNYDEGFPETIEYPDKNMYEIFENSVKEYPDLNACSFLGANITFRQMYEQVLNTATALTSMGIVRGDVATICLPNTPHAVIAFYALNSIGVIANMVHPLTPAHELVQIIKSTNSKGLFVLDAFFHKYADTLSETNNRYTFLCSITDYLSPIKKIGFYVTKGRKIKKINIESSIISWKNLLLVSTDSSAQNSSTMPSNNAISSNSANAENSANSYNSENLNTNENSINSENSKNSNSKRKIEPDDCAVYLHSGGTMGTPKTIMLSSANLNALAIQGPYIIGVEKPAGLKMATILPLFHGFGLCMGMHTMMANGITAVLVPQFSADSLVSLLKNEKPNFIAAVPTLLEGIMKNKKLEKQDLSYLKAVFCGGDTLTGDLKTRFDNFLKSHNCNAQVREGYGLTETVTVCCVNPIVKNRANTVGLPLADMLMCVTEVDTDNEVASGKHGEICVNGPTVMLGYLNDIEATNQAIHVHSDGIKWVHTGDYGFIDEDGYVHFIQRMKRIIKVSGIPVFPSQIEDVIASIPGIKEVSVIGRPHPYKMQVVKAFVVLDNPALSQEVIKNSIYETCLAQIIKHAVPVEIEFLESLPRTKIGKVDTVALEKIDSV